MGRYIQIDYDEMRAVAAELERQGGELAHLMGQLAQRVTPLAGAEWVGSAAQVFAGEVASCQRRMGPLPAMLSSLSGALRHAAGKVEEAEREAAREAEALIRSDNG